MSKHSPLGKKLRRLNRSIVAVLPAWLGRRRRSDAFHQAFGRAWENLEPRLMLAAVVRTDLPDYPPGSTACFNTFNDGNLGTDFQAGETVQFQVLRTDGISDSAPGNLPWNVTDGAVGFAPYQAADGTWWYPDLDGNVDGQIQTSWYVEQQYAGASLLLVAAGQSSGAAATQAFTDSVTVTPASGGTNISADKAANAASPQYTTLGDMVITENSVNDIPQNNANKTVILSAPSGWTFNAGVGTVSAVANKDITASSISVTSSAITLTLTTRSTSSQLDTLTISGIKVRASSGASLPSSGSIFRTGGSFSNISGITNNVTNFGSLSQFAGVATKFGFTTSQQTLVAGIISNTITVQLQDQFANAVNAAAGGQVVNLSSNSAGGLFRDSADTTTITSVTIAAGSSSASFKYIDSLAGTSTITAAFSGLTSATQNETVNAPTPAPPAVIGTASSSSSVASLSLHPSTAVAAGNTIILVLAYHVQNTSPTPSASDGHHNYTTDADAVNTGQERTVIFSAPVTTALNTSDTITVTFPSSNGSNLVALQVAGLVNTSLTDQTHTATGLGTAASSGATATTAQADELLIGAVGAFGNTTGTAGGTGATFTILQNVPNNNSVFTEYAIVHATGTYTASAALTGSSKQWAAAIVSYKHQTPTVSSIVRAAGNPTNAASVSYAVTFSKAVTGVNAGDFSLATSGVSGAAITSVTGSGSSYTVAVSTGTGDGTIGLNLVDNDSVVDANGIPLAGTGTGNGNFTGQVYTIDKTVPTASALAASNAIFSPNNSAGSLDTTTFSSAISDANPGTWTLTLKDSGNNTVRTYSGSTTSVSQAWDGKNSSNAFVADGTYTANLSFSDAAGNAGTSTSPSVVVDNTNPFTASVTTPSSGNSLRTATVPASFSGAVADNSNGSGLNANTATFTLQRATDSKYWNGSAWQSGPFSLAATNSATTTGSSTTWTSSATLPSWSSQSDGSYTVQATVTDKSGNSLTGTAISFTLDNTAPVVTPSYSGNLANDGYYTTTGNVTLATSDATSGVLLVTYTVDGGTQQTYTAPFALTAEGDHVIAYTATDYAGNQTSSTFPVNIDTRPRITGTSGADTITLDYYSDHQTVTVNANSPQNVSLTNLVISGAGGADSLIIKGHGARLTWYTPNATQNGAGQLVIGKRTSGAVTFINIGALSTEDFSKVTLITPNAADSIDLEPVEGGVRASGSSEQIDFTPLTVKNVTGLVLNTADHDGAGGDDAIVLDSDSSDLWATKILVNAGVGENTIDAIGQTHATINTSFGELAGSLVAVNVSDNANINFLSTQVLSALTITDQGRVVLPADKYHVLGTRYLSMGSSTHLDLTSNDMIIHNHLEQNPEHVTTVAQIEALLRTGYNFDARPDLWSGPGIISTTTSGSLTMLGISNEEPLPPDPAHPGEYFPADILVKFTFTGDANLDHTVSIADFITVASHLTQIGGWGQGDFNYDGIVDIADFINLAQHMDYAQPLSPTISGPSQWGFDYTLDLDPGATNGAINGWTVDWGDGDVESFPDNPSSVTHTYDDVGTYAIEASVRGWANIAVTAPTITTTISDAPLWARIRPVPTTITEGSSLALSSLILNDTGATPTYSWLVKKGSYEQTSSASGFTASFPDNGTYTIDLTVSAAGYTAAAVQRTVTVTNVAPTLTLSGPPSIDEGFSYPLSLSWTDPGNDTISKWTIDWGDGSVTHLNRKPSWSSRSISERHTYADGLNGYRILATATDEDGAYTLSANTNPYFGTGGIATAHVGSDHLNRPAMAVLPNGEVLVACDTGSSDSDFAVTLFRADGTKDDTFGDGGTAIIDLGGLGGDDHATGIAVLADGRIAVGGYSISNDDGLTRFGLATISSTGADAVSTVWGFEEGLNYRANSLALQPISGGQRILLGGSATNPANTASTLFAVAAFDATDLNVDTSFGQDGLATVAFSSKSGINALAVQSIDGQPKIVAAGQTGATITTIALARFNSDGSPDSGFNSGHFTTPFGTSSLANALAIGPQNQIVIAGKTDSDFAIVRYQPNGSLDTTFHQTGKTSVDFFGSVDQAYGVAIEADNRTVAVGSATDGSNIKFAIARLTANGGPDTSLSPSGTMTSDLSPGSDVASAVRASGDGRFIVAGQKTITGSATDIAVASYPFLGVRNVEPVAGLSMQSPAEGGVHHATLTAADPGIDTITSWAIDWGDGSAVYTSQQRPVEVSHSYSGPGMRDIVATLTDEDGAHTTTFPTRIAAIPNAPSNLSAVPDSSGDIALHWTNNSTWATRIEIEANIGGGAFTRIATLAPNVTGFNVKGFDPSTSFRVKACSDAGDSAYTDVRGESYNDTENPQVTSLIATDPTDNSISLSWTATDNVGIAGYEISRDGVKVATVAGEAYTDVGLKPDTQYHYTVRAFDLAWNYSDPIDPVSETTDSADITPPDHPTNLHFVDDAIFRNKVDIFWDNVTDAEHYEIYRNGLRLATSNEPTFLADRGYTYDVFAYDAAGNYSAVASLPVAAATSDDSDRIDSASRQYIPDSYQDYFYNTLTPALRRRIIQVFAGAGIPAARHWFDIGADTYLLKGGGVLRQDSVLFEDKNANNRWEPGEPAWKEPEGSIDPHYNGGEPLISGTGTPSSGAVPTIGDIYFKDLNNNLLKGSNEPYFLFDISMLQGRKAAVAYRDDGVAGVAGVAGNNKWDSGEPLWKDSNGDSIYQSSEEMLGGEAPENEAWGKTAGVEYFEENGNNELDTGEIIFAVAETFQQDLEAFYPAVEALIPEFIVGIDGECVRKWTKGNVLAAAGAIIRDGVGLATLDQEQTQLVHVFISDPDFQKKLMLEEGAAIKIANKWYTISGMNASGVNLDSRPPAVTDVAYQVMDWTRVPQLPEKGFAYEPGRYQVSNLVFREQLQELGAVLNQFRTTSPFEGLRVYSVAGSAHFIEVAQKVADIYGSVRGSDSELLIELRELIESGDVNPGRVQYWEHYNLLRRMIVDVSESIYKRNGTGSDFELENGHPQILGPLDQMVDADQELECDDDESPGEMDGDDHLDGAGDLGGTDDLADLIIANDPWILLDSAQTGIHDNGAQAKTTILIQDPGGNYVVDPTPVSGIPNISDFDRWYSSSGCGVGGAGGIYFGGSHFQDTIYERRDLVEGGAARTFIANSHGYFCGFKYVVQNPSATNLLGGNPVTEWQSMSSDGTGPPAGVGLGEPWNHWEFTDVEMRELADLSPAGDPPCGDPEAYFIESDFPVPGRDDNVIWVIDRRGTASHTCFMVSGELVVEEFTRSVGITLGYIDDGWSIVFYGKVPLGHTSLPPRPPHNPLIHPPVDDPPDDDLPQTTFNDFLGGQLTDEDHPRNSPDTDIDDIVEVDADYAAFGDETGLMYFHPQRDGIQTVIPFFTDTRGPLPIHGYLAAGGSAVSTLWTGPDVDEHGVPLAYSLDTRAQANVLLHSVANHRKEIEIVRPRGNSVVFTFNWLPDENRFSDIGYPKSYGDREAKRLYVLRDLTPSDDGDLSYKLMFPSGISHAFGGDGKIIAVSAGDGSNVDVSDFAQRYSLGYTRLQGFLTDPNDPESDPDDPTFVSPRYEEKLVWKNGQINDITYTTRDGEQAIQTTIGYNDRIITHLAKAGGDAGSELPAIDQFSYTTSGEHSITHGPYTVTCLDACQLGNMTIKTTVQDVPGFSEIRTELNPNGLITRQTAHVVTDTNATDKSSSTTYQYKTGNDRFLNQAPKWGKVELITSQTDGTTDDSWQKFEYDDSGRISKIITPLKSTPSTATVSGTRVQTLTYDSTQSGSGQPAESAALLERPRTIISSIGVDQYLVEIGREYRRYSPSSGGATPGPITIRQARLPGAAWDGPLNNNSPLVANLETKITPHLMGPADILTPAGGARYVTETVDDEERRGSRQQIETFGPGGVAISSTEATFDAFGTLLESKTKDAASNLPISKYKNTADGFGRIQEIENQLTGRKASFDDYTWSGPQSSNDFDHVVTSYHYTSAGQLESEETFGVKSEYAYDAAGNVINETRSGDGGSPEVETSARFDALGRILNFTDEEGKLTQYDYTTETDYLSAKITYSDDTTYVEESYFDGSLKAISGTAAYPVEFDSGIDPYAPYLQLPNGDFDGGFWTSITEHSAANTAITTQTYYNPLGQAYITLRPGPTPNIPAYSRTRFDALSRPLQQTGFDGVSTAFSYNKFGDLEDVILDANHDGLRSAGERYTSYFAQYTKRDGDDTPVFQSQTIIHGDNNIVSTSQSSLDGERTWQDDNGLESTSTLRILDDPGASKLTIHHPDGTSTKLDYADRTLASQQHLGTGNQILQSISFTPDKLLRNQSSTDAFGTTTADRLKNGLVNQSTLSDGRTFSITGRDEKTYIPTDITRPDGKFTSRVVDEHGQIVGQYGAGVTPASFEPSPNNGALTNLTTFGHNTATTTWGYAGPTGFLTSKTYADNTGIDYFYNQQLQLEEIDRPGSDEIRSYDPDTGEWIDSDYNNGQLGYHVNWRDSHGLIRQLTQRIGGTNLVTDYIYTAQDQLEMEGLPQFAAAFNTFYEYYGAAESSGSATPGATKSVAIRDGAQDAVKETYSYNESGKRLHSITRTASGTSSGAFTYDYFSGTDLIRSVTAPNGMVTTYDYEPYTGRLASVNASIGSQTLYSIGYTYNDNDQRARADVVWKTAGGSDQAEEWDFDYDEQDQLIFAKAYSQDEPLTGLEFDYSFDAVGNHTESGWTVNIANQVTHIPGLSPEITYDNRGNVLYDGQFHYTWDAADHLIKAENSVAKFEFGYDSQGRRTWKKSFGWVNNAWNLGQHLIFAYDGWNLMAEYEQVTVGSGQNEHIEHHLLRSYAWGQSLGGGIGGLLSITDHTPTTGPKTYYPFYDGNGNIMGLTDNTGQVAATYRYDPFGKLLSSAGPAADINPFRFSTKYYDADTQLYYFGYRSYSPEMQRWMSRDPIEEDGGLNLYAIVGNDPINQVDPHGLDASEPWHHQAAKSIFDPAKQDSELNKLGMKLEEGINIHGKEYGWSIPSDAHVELHSNTPFGERWEKKQREWLKGEKEAGRTVVSKERLEAHLLDMKKQFKLVDAKGVPLPGRGLPAKVDWAGTTAHYTELAKSDKLLKESVTAPERLSKEIAETIPRGTWKKLSGAAAKRGVKIVVGAGAVYMAVSGYNEARADGASAGAAAAVGVIEAVNPLPWSSIEIKNKLAEGAEDLKKIGEEARQGYLEERARNAGMTLREYKELTGEK